MRVVGLNYYNDPLLNTLVIWMLFMKKLTKRNQIKKRRILIVADEIS